MRNAFRRWASSLRPSGRAFLAVAVLVQLAAWNTGENMLYLITGAVVSFLAMSYFFSRWTVSGLTATRDTPNSVHRNELFAETIRIENHKRMMPAVSLRVGCETPEAKPLAFVSKVPARNAAICRVPRTFTRRGVYPLPPISIVSAFPFGLLQKWRTIHDKREITVYPSVKAVRTGVLEKMEGTGETPRIREGEGDEFFSLREYIPGDDLRRIAWRVSARFDKLMIREQEPTTSRRVFVIFDTRCSPFTKEDEEQFEDAVDLAASLAVSFLNRQYFVAVATPDGFVEMGEGNGHAISILELLARVVPADPSSGGTDWFTQYDALFGSAYVYLSSDPERWGAFSGFRNSRVLDPREVVVA